MGDTENGFGDGVTCHQRMSIGNECAGERFHQSKELLCLFNILT